MTDSLILPDEMPPAHQHRSPEEIATDEARASGQLTGHDPKQLRTPLEAPADIAPTQQENPRVPIHAPQATRCVP
jgi:hypothetical protein